MSSVCVPRFYFVLDACGNPVECKDSDEWIRWFMATDRQVALDKIGNLTVSTVFIGFDHSVPLQPGNPILFETMIFEGANLGGIYQRRYHTRDEAIAGHQQAVTIARYTIRMKEIEGP